MEESIQILKPYLRGLPIIIAAMAIGVIGARKYLSYVTPMYESTAKLKLADADEGVPGSNLFKDLDVFATSNKIGAEIEVIKSYALLNKVFDAVQFDQEIYRKGTFKTVELYQNSPIIVQYFDLKEGAYDKIYDLEVLNDREYLLKLGNNAPEKGILGELLLTSNGAFKISKNDTLLRQNSYLQLADHYQFKIISRNQLYQAVLKHLDITAVDKDVAVLRLSYKNANPAKAAMLVNKLAEVYISDYIETKYHAAQLTVRFLDKQISGTYDHLSDTEKAIQEYRETEHITNIRQETETDLRKISQLKIQATNLRMSLDAIANLEQYIQQGQGRFLELAPNFEAFTDLLSTEIVKKIKALQAEKKDLLLEYTPADERVQVVDAKINDLTQYLTESITNTRKNLETKYNNLHQDIETAQKVFVDVPEKERILTSLDREFNIYQQSYNFLNAKKIEAEIAQAARMAFHRVITPAQSAKEPVSPNRAIITIVSAILGLFAALLFIFTVHSVKAKVDTPKNMESTTPIPIATLTPKLHTQDLANAHFLREAIQLELKGMVQSGSVICLSSYQYSEGAAYNALGLCRAFASQGRATLLIDAANQHKMPESGTPVRLSENLDRLTMTDPSFAHSTKDKMAAFLEQYTRQYELVVVINQPLLKEQFALLLMRTAQVNLMVLDARLSPQKRIMESSLLQQEYQIPGFSFLLNRYAYTPSLWKDLLLFFKNIKKAKA